MSLKILPSNRPPTTTNNKLLLIRRWHIQGVFFVQGVSVAFARHGALEGQVVYLICTTKPANTHVGGSYFYTLGFFIQVLRQIIYGHYGWRWMISVYELSNMWDDSQMITIESYVRFIIPSPTKLRSDIVTLPFVRNILVNILESTSFNWFWPNLVHT